MGSLIGFAALLMTTAVIAAQPADLRSRVGAYVEANQKQIVGELLELLSIPNVAADQANIRRNAEHLRALLTRHGVAAEILETTGNPLVYGALDIPGATRTVLFYCHYDGQPVDTVKWNQPKARPRPSGGARRATSAFSGASVRPKKRP